jgi:hypothetical protein
VGTSSNQPPPRRPRFQFSLLGLMVLMFVASAAAAPGFYLLRGKDLPDARVIGMIMMLAGPLLVMTVLSILLSIIRGRD